MPIKLPNNLPAVKTLAKENVFVMTETRAMTQDIRPLKILILNLMPTKIETETQLARLLGNTPIQVELELLQTSTHKAANTSEEHMIAFYKTFSQIKDRFYDGLVITGAPVELLEFEEVEYWDELCEIMEWSKSHVHSTFHICWGAQAGLYYHYGIKKRKLDNKLSGVFEHTLDYKTGMLFRGFDDTFYVPHSRNTTVDIEDVERVKELKIISKSEEAGIFAIKSNNDRQIFIMGHSEYDADTLLKEYVRDKNAGLNPKVPCNYFPNDDDTKEPIVRWRSCANLLYTNWLNYFVYQSTTYDISKIEEDKRQSFFEEEPEIKVSKFGGTSLSSSEQFKKVARIVTKDDARKYVVVSAPGKRNQDDTKVTDLLIKASKEEDRRDEYLNQVRERFEEITSGLEMNFDVEGEIEIIKDRMRRGASRDYVVSRGEYLNGKILAKYLDYDFVDGTKAIVFDDEGNFLAKETHHKLVDIFRTRENAVIPGFYGAKKDGSIVTFPRGGSDITGAIVAEAAGAGIYENWTDVSGLLMADPRIVDNPISVPVITYKELRELSAMGATVMHEDAVFPVKKVGIPISIRNTNKPGDLGTLIVKNADYYKSNLSISGISGNTGNATIVIEKDKLNEEAENRTALLRIFEKRNITIKNMLAALDGLSVIVNQSEISSIESELVDEIKHSIKASNVTITEGLAMIAVVGRKLSDSPAVAVRVLGALANRKINIKLIDHGSEKINMLIGVDQRDYVSAVQSIYEEFTKKQEAESDN